MKNLPEKELNKLKSEHLETQYQSLCLLAEMLIELAPKKIKTKNPYSRIVNQITLINTVDEEKLKALFYKLVHGFTSINYTNRMKIMAYYQSEKQDNLIALILIQKLAFPVQTLSPKILKTYSKLWQFYKTDYSFSVVSCKQEILKDKSLSTIKRHLKALVHTNKIVKVAGNRKVGYIYKLVPKR